MGKYTYHFLDCEITMTLPPLSIICPTYGRTACLSEVVESYIRSAYDGEMELLLLNDVKEQFIIAEGIAGRPITVVNQESRSPSLGDKRNDTVKNAKHEHFLFVDDDDIFLPWYAEDMMRSFLAWEKPTYPHAYYHADGKDGSLKITYKKQTHPASYLATKTQFDKVEGYPFVYAGGDQLIRSKLFNMYKSHPNKHPFPNYRAGYIYRWGNGTYHISGSSDHASAWDRTRDSLEKRLESGVEPSGVVRVKPAWKNPYRELIKSIPT